MENYNVLPEVGMGEALMMGLARVREFASRSRRSEFWWFMLVFLIVKWAVGFVLQLWSFKADSVAECLLWLVPLALTVRRLHDSGHSGCWVYVSYVLGCAVQLLGTFSPVYDIVLRMGHATTPDKVMKYVQDPWFMSYTGISLLWMLVSLVVIVMCCLDSQKGANRYGESPKYVPNAEK